MRNRGTSAAQHRTPLSDPRAPPARNMDNSLCSGKVGVVRVAFTRTTQSGQIWGGSGTAGQVTVLLFMHTGKTCVYRLATRTHRFPSQRVPRLVPESQGGRAW